jgi:hypothetical protein
MATRDQVEAILIRRAGALLRKAGLDGTTVDGTNPDLADPISSSLRRLGVVVVDMTDPTDIELALLDDDDLEEFLDRAELRTLHSILGNWIKPNAQQDTDRQDWGDLIDLTRERIDALQSRVDTLFPSAQTDAAAGLISYDFQARYDDDDSEV